MSRREIMTASAKSALADRARQTREISELSTKIAASIRQIEQSAQGLPEQIETAANNLTAAAEAMSKLVRDSSKEIKAREKYLSELDTRIEAQATAMGEAAKAMRQAAIRSERRIMTRDQVVRLVLSAAFSGAIGSIILFNIWLHWPELAASIQKLL